MISKKEYKKILKYYENKKRKKNTTSKYLDNKYDNVKKTVHDILAYKLCSCIKKLNKTVKNEPRSIAICTNSVINKKGISRGRFTCKTKDGKKTRKSIELYK